MITAMRARLFNQKSSARLFVLLPADQQNPRVWWWCTGLPRATNTSGQLCQLSEINQLAAEIKSAELTLIIPAEQAVLETVTYQGKSQLTAEQLARLLEDKLGKPSSDYHWWKRAATQPLLVGCDLAWLTDTMQQLREVGLTPKQLLVEWDFLPELSEGATAVIMQNNQRWLVKLQSGAGFWLKPDWVTQLLPRWNPAEKTDVYGELATPQSWHQYHPNWQCFQASCAISDHRTDNLLKGLPKSLRWSDRQVTVTWLRWGLPLFLSLIILGLLARLTFLTVQNYQDQNQLVQLYQQWSSEKNLSGDEVIGQITQQRQQQLAMTGGHNFFDLLASYLQFIRSKDQPEIKRMSFIKRQQQMQVELVIPKTDVQQFHDVASTFGQIRVLKRPLGEDKFKLVLIISRKPE